MRPLVIVGAGGFARETAAALRALNRLRPGFRLLGYVDDDPALGGRQVSGLPVLGPVDLVRDLPYAAVVICAGSPRDHLVRERLARRLDLPPDRYAVVVHPSAEVADCCVVGPGSVLLAHAVLTADVRLGAHVAVMPHAVLTHDNVVEDHVTIASGVRLGGGVRLAAGAYVGAGALVREHRTVGAGALVGMGSVVLDDVPPAQVWVGCPARYLRAVGPSTLTYEGIHR